MRSFEDWDKGAWSRGVEALFSVIGTVMVVRHGRWV